MNRKQIIAALTLALTAGATFTHNAFAADDNNGAKTRAQVYAELEQARADGSFYSLGEGTPRRLTRARLAEQLAKARRDGADADAAAMRAAEPANAAAPQRAGS